MASVHRAPAASHHPSCSGSATTLPEIPPLAPLEPIPVPRLHTDDSIAVLSSASHDTFMTALTSSPPTNSPPDNSTMNSHLAAPHSLRKSISVDSFIKDRPSPDLSESSANASVRKFTHEFDSDAGHIRHFQAVNASTPDSVVVERPPLPNASKSLRSRILGRSRGHSLSEAIAEHDDPFLEDSEQERTSDMAHLPLMPHRSRSASSPFLNGYGKTKRTRSGELLLPSRTPTLSNASSASSLSSATPYTDGIPPVPPIPHLHNTRAPILGPLIMPHRSRSESLPNGGGDVSIAVVGALGCGKSTVIRKGLKNWGLSDESICGVTTAKARLRYSSRTVTIPPGQQSARLAHVYELDSETLQLDTPDGAWPEGLPPIDGVLVCYDASDLASFARIPDLLACYQALHLSAVAIACKCDLEKKVPPHWASDRATQFNVGLVEVTSATDPGKKKMRHCFSWILRSVSNARRGDHRAGSPYRNPASPDVLTAPWADGFPEGRTSSTLSHGSAPSVNSPPGVLREYPPATSHIPSTSPAGTSTPTPRSPSAPTSPTRVRSTGDLLSEMERSKRESPEGRGNAMGPLGRMASASAGSLHEMLGGDQPTDKDGGESLEEKNSRIDTVRSRYRDPPQLSWATLEELLENLFFVAVTGDDKSFIEFFSLTYRRFATPRSVLLGMQKRVRLLHSDVDSILGTYAQQRISDMLEDWIERYPHDFSTPGASGALTALVKQMLSNAMTVHYGSDLLPFLDEIPQLDDHDASWSVRMDQPGDESDDDDGVAVLDDEGEEGKRKRAPQDPPAISDPVLDPKPKLPQVFAPRERKGSLSSKSLLSSDLLTTTVSGSSGNSRVSSKDVSMPKASIKELLKVSQVLSQCDIIDVAEEITRQQSELFMSIEPRQWLRYAMGNSRPETDKDEPISGCAAFYNRLSNWVTSLILAHDRIKSRSRQVERFSELAHKLRVLNNYTGLRAVMTGINNATYPNDEVMMLFMQNKKHEYKIFRSYEVLLNSTRNHRAYRMALKHTMGPAIPDMEVHTFDMVRAHESNDDYRLEQPSKIHWGKFSLMARMITTLHGFQKRIVLTRQYDYAVQPHIRRLLAEPDLMDEEMQRSRVIPPPDDTYEVPYPTTFSLDSQSSTKPDAARLKRLFFW